MADLGILDVEFKHEAKCPECGHIGMTVKAVGAHVVQSDFKDGSGQVEVKFSAPVIREAEANKEVLEGLLGWINFVEALREEQHKEAG